LLSPTRGNVDDDRKALVSLDRVDRVGLMGKCRNPFLELALFLVVAGFEGVGEVDAGALLVAEAVARLIKLEPYFHVGDSIGSHQQLIAVQARKEVFGTRPGRRPQKATTRPSCPALARRKNSVLWGVFAVFRQPVNRLTLSAAGDPGYQDDVWLILRGVEGNWFHAWSEWEKVANPLIAGGSLLSAAGRGPYTGRSVAFNRYFRTVLRS